MAATLAEREVAGELLHLILEGELTLLQNGFFQLFGVREVVLAGEFVEAIVEVVVLLKEGPVPIV